MKTPKHDKECFRSQDPDEECHPTCGVVYEEVRLMRERLREVEDALLFCLHAGSKEQRKNAAKRAKRALGLTP